MLFTACFAKGYRKAVEEVSRQRSHQDDNEDDHMTFKYKSSSRLEKSKATVTSQGQQNIFTLQKTRTDKLSWQQFPLPKYYV